jgi:hypothetical protein
LCDPVLRGLAFVCSPGKINRPDTLRQGQGAQADLEYWSSVMLPTPNHAKATLAILVRQNQNFVIPHLTGQADQMGTIPADICRDCVLDKGTSSLVDSVRTNWKLKFETRLSEYSMQQAGSRQETDVHPLFLLCILP